MATEVLHRHHHSSSSGHMGAQEQHNSPNSPHPQPPVYHPQHSSSSNDTNNHNTEDTNAVGVACCAGPSPADFAGDNNNDLDEPRMIQNPDGTVEDWNHITKPGGNDVLLGRGGGTNNHSGNVKFRHLVNEHKMSYLACSKVDKPKVAREVVAIWRKMVPPGRFLARKDETKRGPGSVKANDNVWFEVGDKKAREKASQCLRERTPDVLPYIKHLRDQQNAVTEYGIMQMQHQQPSYGAPSGYPAPHHHHHNHHPHHMPQPEYHAPHPHLAARRNSAPQPLPHLHPHAPQSYGGRRASSNGIYEDEYQQQMMLMHQTMMQQHNSPYMQHPPFAHQGYDQHQQHQQHLQPSHSEDTTADADDTAPNNNNNNIANTNKKRVAPDRAISLMSFTAMDAPHHDDPQHELSLEDYRQQLEEYIANCQAEDGGNPNGQQGAANDDHHSDLEDDWERERELAIQQQQQQSSALKRGVGRNVSGLSCFSNKSGHMSLVSNLSNFDARDAKMSMARSDCSNLSLMSELTDLSQNIDNLSIYDD